MSLRAAAIQRSRVPLKGGSNLSFVTKIYVQMTNMDIISNTCEQRDLRIGTYGDHVLYQNAEYERAVCGYPICRKGYFGEILFVIDKQGSIYYYNYRNEVDKFRQTYAVESVKLQLEKEKAPYKIVEEADGKIKIIVDITENHSRALATV